MFFAVILSGARSAQSKDPCIGFDFGFCFAVAVAVASFSPSS
jgi:hypothetical protein